MANSNSIVALVLVALAVVGSASVETADTQQVEGPSTLRKELIDELRSARQQEEPQKEPRSALRDEIIAELRAARQQSEPKKEPRSALRDEIVAELQSARAQAEPQATAPRSALRDDIIAELRDTRIQLEVPEAPAKPPSALRKQIIEELRNAREMFDKEEAETNVAKQRIPKVGLPIEVSAPVQEEQELPWSDDEQLLNEPSAPVVAPAVQVAAASALAENVLAFNRLLRTFVLSGTAMGLAAVSKLPELELKLQGRSPAQQVTLALFFAPLVLVSADYLFDLAVGNEFALIAGSWGLAAMACVHQRMKAQ